MNACTQTRIGRKKKQTVSVSVLSYGKRLNRRRGEAEEERERIGEIRITHEENSAWGMHRTTACHSFARATRQIATLEELCCTETYRNE